MKQSLCLCAMSVALLMPCIHGKEFTNLTFDEPDLSGDMTPLFPGFPNGPFGGSTAQLLRGWSATADGVPITTMAYSPYPGRSGAAVSLLETAPGAVNGRFELILISTPRPPGPEIRISQRGMIPQNAISLLTTETSRVIGYVDGQFIGTSVENSVLSHWDVRRFAGQEVELSIVLPSNTSSGFDILGFELIPEPSTTALLAVGGLGLGWLIVSRSRAGAGSGKRES